jgi:hypothetical protein
VGLLRRDEMPKFKVTIFQHVLEMKEVVVEAEDADAAIDVADREDGDGFEFVEIPDRWINTVELTDEEE